MFCHIRFRGPLTQWRHKSIGDIRDIHHLNANRDRLRSPLFTSERERGPVSRLGRPTRGLRRDRGPGGQTPGKSV